VNLGETITQLIVGRVGAANSCRNDIQREAFEDVDAVGEAVELSFGVLGSLVLGDDAVEANRLSRILDQIDQLVVAHKVSNEDLVFQFLFERV